MPVLARNWKGGYHCFSACPAGTERCWNLDATSIATEHKRAVARTATVPAHRKMPTAPIARHTIIRTLLEIHSALAFARLKICSQLHSSKRADFRGSNGVVGTLAARSRSSGTLLGSGIQTIDGLLVYSLDLRAMREDKQVDGHQMAHCTCQNEEVPTM
jgi:hypothetical protein